MKKFKTLGILGLATVTILSTPMNTFAQTIEEITSSKEVVLKMVPLTTPYFLDEVNEKFGTDYAGYTLRNCNEEVTECEIFNMREEKNLGKVKVTYDYDPSIKKVVDRLIKKMGSEEKTFSLNDIESINYFYSNRNYIKEHPEITENPEFVGYALEYPSFSSDLKKFFEYSNFEIRVGIGEENPYFNTQAGEIQFWYDDTLYGVGPMTTVVDPYVVYIPEDATNIEEAIKNRFSKYYKVVNVEKITTKTVEQLLEDEKKGFESYWDSTISTYPDHNGYANKEEYVKDMMNTTYNNEEAPGHFMTIAEDYQYSVKFEDGFETILAVVKDNEKAKDTRKVVTNDSGTGVEISTEGLIPLDTLIKVAKVTSGEEYDKIVSLLKVNNMEMFDLKLFSTSEEKFITKLEDGTFNVRLPISETLKGKELIVYHVKDDDTIEEHAVTLDGDYAVFSTDHFSIYTLAEAPGEISNPATGDKIVIYVLALATSLIGILGTTMFFKKKIK